MSSEDGSKRQKTALTADPRTCLRLILCTAMGGAKVYRGIDMRNTRFCFVTHDINTTYTPVPATAFVTFQPRRKSGHPTADGALPALDPRRCEPSAFAANLCYDLHNGYDLFRIIRDDPDSFLTQHVLWMDSPGTQVCGWMVVYPFLDTVFNHFY